MTAEVIFLDVPGWGRYAKRVHCGERWLVVAAYPGGTTQMVAYRENEKASALKQARVMRTENEGWMVACGRATLLDLPTQNGERT